VTATPTRIGRVWMIGCGNMGGAMLRQWIASGALAADSVDVVNRSDRPLPAGVRQARHLPDGPLPDAVVLAMKPQQLDEVAARFALRLTGVPVLVSILAGVEEAALSARFGADAYLRAMPNLPVGIGKGVVALDTSSADPVVRGAVAALMAPLGLVEWVAPAQFDAVTALAGSGPAFLYRFIDALSAAGVAQGLPEDQAARLALATVEGAGLLAAAADVGPGQLAERVASPGGSTRKGLEMLDAGDALKALLTETIAASTRRNAEMAATARG
jgi:pyrroline-5-carboxylate reductase